MKQVKLKFSKPDEAQWLLNILDYYAKDKSHVLINKQVEELELLHYDLSKQLQKQTRSKKKKKHKSKK